MRQETKTLLIKYAVSFVAASLITVAVFAFKGFFDHSAAVNMQILSDGFCVSGLMLLLYAGMMYVASEGALLGISFILRNVVLAIIPLGRLRHITYKEYREEKMEKIKKFHDHSALVVGSVFFLVGVVFTIIWYVNYYNIT